MVRKMYDSTDPNAIPADAEIVAYYPHAWGSDMSKHSAALQLRIDNTGAHADDCHALDVESGAASITTAAEWIQSWHKLHPEGMHIANGEVFKPVIYISTSNLSALRSACSGLVYDVWAAQWDGGTTQIPGCFARQYADPKTSGGDYDVSFVYDDTWGHAPTQPVPPPVPAPVPPHVITGVVTWWDNGQYYTRNVTWNGPAATWHS